MKSKITLMFVLGLLSACQPIEEPVAEPETALTSRVGEEISVVSGISPNLLKIGNVLEARCVEIVEVQTPDIACQKNDCTVKAFHNELMPAVTGQRALRVSDCGSDAPQPQLLTDREPRFNSTAILILQETREGENLWRQLKVGNEYTIELATEAAEGILSLNSQGDYEWNELPD